IIDAIDFLSRAQTGGCYQLADPAPMTVDQLIDVIAADTNRRIVRIPPSKAVAKLGAPLLRIPAAAVDYFWHSTRYDTTNAQRGLAGSGISVPRFAEYAPKLVEFFRAHPEISSAA